MIVTLASRDFVPPELSIVLVLGINLGSSIITPLFTRNAEPGVHVFTIRNLLMRGASSLVMFFAFLWLKSSVTFLGSTVPDQIINAPPILFNCLILVGSIPLAKLV